MNVNQEAEIFDGRAAANAIAADLKAQIQKLHLTPKLIDFAIEPDERSLLYMQTKRARAQELGIKLIIRTLDDVTMLEAKEAVRHAVADSTVHGVMLQLPLPIGYSTSQLIALIPPTKDVDGMNFVARDDDDNEVKSFAPATPAAVMEILRLHKVALRDQPVLLIGQGPLVGQPLAILLRQAGANLSLADEQTLDLAELTQQAKVIISATGQPKLITADMIQPGAVVIDVGIAVENGQPASDVDFASVRHKASFVTPPTGGVGPMTVIMLMKNVVAAATRATKK